MAAYQDQGGDGGAQVGRRTVAFFCKIKHCSCGKKTSVGAFHGCCSSGCGFEGAMVALPLAPAP